MALEDDFLGRGWSFPPTFSKADQGVQMVAGVRDIEQSLANLLSTRLRERLLTPDFGCDLHNSVFEAMNTTVITRIKDMVSTAILYHEARIELLEVSVSEPPESLGTLLIEVQYRVRATNSRRNYVYPFYKVEGSEIGG